MDVGDLSGHVTASRTSTTVDGRFVRDSVQGSWGLTNAMLVYEGLQLQSLRMR